jgi:hypothetical protein
MALSTPAVQRKTSARDDRHKWWRDRQGAGRPRGLARRDAAAGCGCVTRGCDRGRRLRFGCWRARKSAALIPVAGGPATAFRFERQGLPNPKQRPRRLPSPSRRVDNDNSRVRKRNARASVQPHEPPRAPGRRSRCPPPHRCIELAALLNARPRAQAKDHAHALKSSRRRDYRSSVSSRSSANAADRSEGAGAARALPA